MELMVLLLTRDSEKCSLKMGEVCAMKRIFRENNYLETKMYASLH